MVTEHQEATVFKLKILSKIYFLNVLFRS